MTILSIAQKCTQRLQITDPASFIGSTNNNYILLLAMINRAIDEISNEFEWPELTKHYPFQLVDGLDAYPLPADYDRRINETLWNKDQHWPLIGPVTAQIWEQYINGFITTLPRQRFRVKGAANNQFFINPRPEGVDGQTLVYEYISKNKRRPKTWVASTAYALNAYAWSDGLLLKCTTNGTSHSAQIPEFGRDGTCFWESVPAFVASSNYYVGQYVFANSKVYYVSVAGKAGAAPSHSSGSATSGTVTFDFMATPSTWAGGTSYTYSSTNTSNTYVVNATPDAYRLTQTGISGNYSPKFRNVLSTDGEGIPPYTYTSTITDNTVVWTVQYDEYSFTADTDEILLNEQMIIDGACWRFLQARGFDYMQDKAIADEQKEAIKANKIGASSVDLSYLAYSFPWCIGWWSYPEGNYNPPS